jgi:chorismate synthase
VAQKILDTKKIQILAYAESIGEVFAEKFNSGVIEKNPVRCADAAAAKAMEKLILAAQKAGDSVGGVIGITVKNTPAGLGEPVFGKADALLAQALMSIGAVKGIEFGEGFAFAELHGSEANDAFTTKGKRITKKTNLSGGILGGITDGDEIVIRCAVKPTASISKIQETVDIRGKAKKISIVGRHDACIIPRIIPVAEAMVRITLADLLLQSRCNRI